MKNIIKQYKKFYNIINKIIIILFIILSTISLCILILLGKYFYYIQEIFFTFSTIKNLYYKSSNIESVLKYMPKYIVKIMTNDPYSDYYDKDEFKIILDKISGQYSGIGVVLGIKKNTKQIEVLNVYQNTPAYEKGIRKGDIFLKIQKKELINLSNNEIKNIITGDLNTDIEIDFFSLKDNKKRKLILKRKLINIPTVFGEYKDFLNDIFYIEIDSFNENTDKEFDQLINNLKKKPKKIILDLRNNSGGIVEKSLAIAEYFVPKGIIMHEIGKYGKNIISFNSKGNKFLNIPIIVLINENTASASEILAAAIKERGNGILIGKKTLGKSTIQSIIRTPNKGGINLTTKRYLTPNKIDINKKGLIPDIEINVTKENNKFDFMLQNSIEILRGNNEKI